MTKSRASSVLTVSFGSLDRTDSSLSPTTCFCWSFCQVGGRLFVDFMAVVGTLLFPLKWMMVISGGFRGGGGGPLCDFESLRKNLLYFINLQFWIKILVFCNQQELT